MELILAISYFTTSFDILKKHWKNQAILRNSGVLGTISLPPGNFNGKVTLVDWKTKKIIKEVEQKSPSGLLKVKNRLYVNDAKDNEIYEYSIENLDLIGKIKNKYFNDLHSISLFNPDNFLITSSGLDLIQVLDLKGNTKYAWWAYEHGFNRNPLNEVINYNKKQDYSNTRIPTLKQATHVNYALCLKDESILASLFHQGICIRITPKNSMHEIVISGLKQPHTILEIDNSFFIADSNNNRVLILDKQFHFVNQVQIKNSWIQDIHELIHKGEKYLLIADATYSAVHLLRLKDYKIIDSYKFDTNWRVSAIEIISEQLPIIK